MKMRFRLPTLLLIFVLTFMLTPATLAKSFNFQDLGTVSWAEDEIHYLADGGIINGYSDTVFGPKDMITRAQATVLLVNALYPNEVAEELNQFPDVEEGLYYTNAIRIATEKNLIAGYVDGSFRPDDKITRAETASLINRAFAVKKGDRNVTFTDALGWSKEHILNLASNGIIAGYADGSFGPNKEISRAEFAVIIARTIEPGFIPPVNQEVDQATQFEQEVLRLTNKKRLAHGLEPLHLDKKLFEVARLKSKDMDDYDYFDHNSPNYGSPFEMMKEFGIQYQSAGENIAFGYGSPEAVVNGWMNSPGHRANILNESFTHLGVGFSNYYWTQMFIEK